jgi:hypothetical protein
LSTTSYVATNAEIAPSLGRNLAAGANATVTLPMMSRLACTAIASAASILRLGRASLSAGPKLVPSRRCLQPDERQRRVCVQHPLRPQWLYATTIQDPRVFRSRCRRISSSESISNRGTDNDERAAGCRPPNGGTQWRIERNAREGYLGRRGGDRLRRAAALAGGSDARQEGDGARGKLSSPSGGAPDLV